MWMTAGSWPPMFSNPGSMHCNGQCPCNNGIQLESFPGNKPGQGPGTRDLRASLLGNLTITTMLFKYQVVQKLRRHLFCSLQLIAKLQTKIPEPLLNGQIHSLTPNAT